MPPKKPTTVTRSMSERDVGNHNSGSGVASTSQSTPIINTISVSNVASDNVDSADFKTLFSNIAKEFSDKLERIKADFNKQITELHEMITQLINGFTSKQYVEIDKRLDAIERNQQAKTIVIDGIPYTQCNNNPTKFFDTFCADLSLQTPACSEIFCTKSSKNKNDCGSLIIKLNCGSDKFKILKAAKNKAKTNGALTLKNIGISSNEPIYVHESLTKRNYKVYREALRSKKKFKFSSVFTANGCVFIKVKSDDQPQYISCLDDLHAVNQLCGN